MRSVSDVLVAIASATICSTQVLAQPAIIPHSQWQSQPPVGYVADAMRRNEPPGGTLVFHDLSITVLGTSADSSRSAHKDEVHLRLRSGDAQDERQARDGEAFNWHGYHVAIVAIYGKGELGGGLVALEVATVASLPSVVVNSLIAGGANMRLRVPQQITSITLHHEGSEKPLRPTDNPIAKLRGLQSWGASDRKLQPPGADTATAEFHRRSDGLGDETVPRAARQHPRALPVRSDQLPGKESPQVSRGRNVSQVGAGESRE